VGKLSFKNDGSLCLASDFRLFVDDNRTGGSSEEECWNATKRFAQLVQYLGIQDAPRKRRPPSRTPGAWAGSVVRIFEEGIGVSVCQEKWNKLKTIADRWEAALQVSDLLDHTQLEKDRGFLIYVARTFPALKPYLKGFHLTLDGWRKNRDKDGWKKKKGFEEVYFADDDEPLEAPDLVHAATRSRSR
jgi:hypothetical protein